MQTFMPLPDFRESLRALDYRRLGKQRLEARQVLKALTEGGGWANHPCVSMWRGYEGALIRYGNLAIEEWIGRGYNNTMPLLDGTSDEAPPWLGDEDFHRSHQSNLVRKLREHYGPLFPGVPDDLPYVWPKGANDES